MHADISGSNVQIIVGDNNTTSVSSAGNACDEYKNEIQQLKLENELLKTDIQWAKQQLRIKDILIKKLLKK